MSRIATDTQSALADMQRLFEEDGISIDSGGRAWGQFLDRMHGTGQYGIYGTAAAIQVLNESGYSPDSQLLRDADSVFAPLRDRAEKSAFDRDDLNITFKVAAVLAADRPSEDSYDEQSDLETSAIGWIVDGRGWGNHSLDPTPRTLPTSHMLVALRRSRRFRDSATCEGVLAWLADQALRINDDSVHDMAMALISLSAYGVRPGTVQDAIENARKTLLERIEKWAMALGHHIDIHSVQYHFTVPSGTGDHNHYLFYLPEVLAARAIMEARLPHGAQRFIASTVAECCTNIRVNHGYRVLGNNRLATVDQLEVGRLLRCYYNTVQDRPWTLMPKVARAVSGSTTRRVVTLGILLVVAAISGVGTGEPKLSVWVRVSAGVLLAVSASLVANLIWEWGARRHANS